MKKCDLHGIYIWDFQIPTVINGDILVGIQWVYIYMYIYMYIYIYYESQLAG